MITAKEAIQLTESLDISKHTAYLSTEIHRAAMGGLRSIKLCHKPYNCMGSNYATPEATKILEALKASGFDVIHLPSNDQREPDSVRISW